MERFLMRVFSLVVLLIMVLAGLYWLALRPWYERWGAVAAEAAAKMPGDDIASNADLVSTRAVTVRATPEKIYPWLVQIGYQRAGMYSYEWIENLIGCDLHNVYRIVPELQKISPGQELAMGPKGYPFYRVEGFEPNRYLLLRPGDPKTREPGSASWLMLVQDQGNGTSRLIMRQRQKMDPGLGSFVMWRLFVEPISFVMEQKMMRTIRDLAETR
jgi:hypothetical protein